MTEPIDPRPRMTDIARLIYARYLSNAAGGNMSVRVGERVYITPRFMGSKHQWNIAPEQINVVGLDGSPIEGVGDLSRESKAHLAVYRAFSYAGSVIHAHPRYGSVFAMAGRPIPPTLEYTEKFGTIQVVPPYPSHSAELAEAVVAALQPQAYRLEKHGLALVLAWHGVLAVGRDLDDAYDVLERMEWSAHNLLMGALLERIPQDPSAWHTRQGESLSR